MPPMSATAARCSGVSAPWRSAAATTAPSMTATSVGRRASTSSSLDGSPPPVPFDVSASAAAYATIFAASSSIASSAATATASSTSAEHSAQASARAATPGSASPVIGGTAE